MRGQAVLAAAFAATTLMAAQPAAAQNYNSYHDAHVAPQEYCQQQRNNRTATGALIGAIGGAVLGSQAAARGHRSDGSLLGGVVGAAAGAAIGRSSANQACRAPVQGSYDPYYGRPQYSGGYGQQPYYGDDRDLEGGPYRQSSYGYGDDRYARNGGECRWGEQVMRDPDGYEYRENVYMCRGRDGVWRPQD